MTEENTAPTMPKLKTGFAIFIDMDGNIYVEREPEALSVEIERPANLLEVRRAASEVLSDLQAQASAEYVAARLGLMNQGEAPDVR